MSRTSATHRSNGDVLAASVAAPRVLQRVLRCLTAVQKGDFSARMPSEWTGLEGKVADAFNEIIASNERMAKELKRRTARTIELKSLNHEHPDRTFAADEVLWIARILWASQ